LTKMVFAVHFHIAIFFLAVFGSLIRSFEFKAGRREFAHKCLIIVLKPFFQG
jgi:hypothetical protein